MRVEALAHALREMSGPRLSFGPVEGGQLPIRWDGVEEARVWTGHDDPADLALFALDASHAAALEGLGRRGEHPGAWANAVPELDRRGESLRLRLLLDEDEVAAAPVPLARRSDDEPSTEDDMTALSSLHRSLEHTLWGHRRVLAALQSHPSAPAQATRLLAHLLAAEVVWLGRLRGADTATLPVWPDWDLEECARRLPGNGADLRALLASLTGARLERVVTYRNTAGAAFETAVGDILHHVFSHGAYHRGQIALLLRQAGLEPVNTDFITFVRETGG